MNITIFFIILTIILAVFVYMRLRIKTPSLSGQYKVGKVSYNLVDKSRLDILREDGKSERNLMVTVYYPAEPLVGEKPSPHVDKATKRAIFKTSRIPGFMFSNIKSHSYNNAPVSSDKPVYPVLLFSPGMNSQPLFISSLLEDIASQGYIIAAVSHPYKDMFTVYPDGKFVRSNKTGTDLKNRPMVVKVCCEDIMFVLDQLGEMNKNDKILAGHIDFTNAGVFGHSFGGATATQAAMSDKRIKAVINMDGSVWGDQAKKGLDQPYMFMICKDTGPTMFLETPDFKRIYENSKECHLFYLLNSGHNTYETDICLMSKRYRFINLGDFGTIPAKKAFINISKYIVIFFNKHLKGISSDLLESDEPIVEEYVWMRKYVK